MVAVIKDIILRTVNSIESTMTSQKDKRKLFLLVSLFILLIFLTRIFCLDHEMINHPDEGLFAHASASLWNKILNPSEFYTEHKPYPQGSFIFFLPFQILHSVFAKLTGGFENSARLFNRIGSVVYYSVGAILGCDILNRFFKNKKSVFVYALLILFSLFHIEQSRYGTGEAITFMLLMIAIHSSASYLNTSKIIHILISSLAVGFMAAVKYPQIYFCLIPLSVLFLNRETKNKRLLLHLAVCITGLVVGFFIISPGPIQDLQYIIEVSQRELNAYINKGTLAEKGGLLNHIISFSSYWLLYSDFLFAPFFFFIGILSLKKLRSASDKDSISTFFVYALPLIALIFAIYNLFVTTFFMRTLYPFFCISLLYTSIGVVSLFKSKKKLVCALLILTVLRGATLIAAYIPENSREHTSELISEAVDISGGERFLLIGSNAYILDMNDELTPYLSIAEKHTQEDLYTKGFPEVKSGDVVITGTMEFGVSAPYPIRINDDKSNALIDGWTEFKQNNAEYYVGQSYPQYYGYLFGFWIRGVPTSKFDFPTYYIYAIP